MPNTNKPKTYPNQLYCIGSFKSNIEKEPFSQLKWSSQKAAIKNLTSSGFLGWLYFMKNAAEYQFAISREDIMDWCDCSERTYSNIIKELKTKRYLIKVPGKKNSYKFFETPMEENFDF